MKLSQFNAAIQTHPEKNVRFIFPDGDLIEAEFHVTEVGHVAKKFIDCGGTIRSTEACVLQTWVSDKDTEHRLSGAKLAKIMDSAKSVLPSSDLEVEIEYEGCVLSQYSVTEFRLEDSELRFSLGSKHTDCLAKELCGVESSCCTSGAGVCC